MIEKVRKILLGLLSIVCSVFLASAQEKGETRIERDTICATIYFQRSYSMPSYGLKGVNNQIRLCELSGEFNKIRSQGGVTQIESIEIESAASPDGLARCNVRLSAKCAQTFIATIKDLLESAEIPYSVTSHGIDWRGLDSLLSRSHLPYRNELLHIIRTSPEFIYDANQKIIDGRLRKLQMFRGGVPYKNLYENLFPELCYAKITIVYTRTLKVEPEPKPEFVPEPKPEVKSEPEFESKPASQSESEIQVASEPIAKKKSMRELDWAFKTNLLSDVALILQFGLEVMLGENWSLSGSYNFAWWRPMSRKHYAYGGVLELRRWWDPNNRYNTFAGHHFGIYVQAQTYDMEGKKKGYLVSKPQIGGGISYGYSWPVLRCMNIDVSVGLGYLAGKYEEYKFIDDHYVWQATKRLHWFGPTKAEISLVWLFGPTNRIKKGGVR